MGFLDNGKWIDKWYDTKSTDGNFVRRVSHFRNKISGGDFKPEKGRYKLIISHACPWAHRTHIFVKLKKLDSIIDIYVVDPIMLEHGWVLDDNARSYFGCKYLYEIYKKSDPLYVGRVTVPVLWDKKTETIVNNESSEIIRMFNNAFDHITGNSLDFYPEVLRTEIDEINQYVYHNINNGVYKVGFATSQSVYDKEIVCLFKALDYIEDTLSRQHYLVGNQLTEADWRLYTTLIRFDCVYVGHFKCNIRTISSYSNISRFIKRLSKFSGIEETSNIDHIKTHYYVSHKMINPTGIVPAGPVFIK
jgi:glutathionyl-hydroquinone reductase